MKPNHVFVFVPCHQEENLVNFRLERTSPKWPDSAKILQLKLKMFIFVPLLADLIEQVLIVLITNIIIVLLTYLKAYKSQC